jgi:ABC-type transporter MlaC component
LAQARPRERLERENEALHRLRSEYADEDQKLTTEFRLYQTEKGWRIYDVITDGESLLLIYRNQHSGIIKEKGFPHLIKLMEKKLNEAK